ncbi:MAG: hypothetical protein QXT22_02375 [Candidatus Hadarchaeales archaeon]
MKSPEEAEIRQKVARAAQLLLFKHRMEPGARRWELRRAVGKNYEEILKILDSELEKLGLEVKVVKEAEEVSESDRFLVVFRGHPSLGDVRTFGWRIDDMAMLTVALSYILAKGGKAPLKEIEKILEEKFPKWRVEATLERFIRRGYLSEDEKGVAYIGWRTRAEIDQKTLLSLLLGREAGGKEGDKRTPEAEPQEE